MNTYMYKSSMYNVVIKEENERVLLYNTNSGSLCWIPIEFYNKLNNEIKFDEAFEELIKTGFIVKQDVDEFSKLEFEKNAFIFNKSPNVMGFVIAPTLGCNMHCSYCFENNASEKKTMTLYEAKKATEFIMRELKKNTNVKKLWIRWFGGEPCLAMDIIRYISKELIEFCDKNNILFSSFIVTNGELLNRENAMILKNECRITRCQITLDGLRESYEKIKGVKKGTFNKVIDNIVEIAGIIKVIVRVNVSYENIKEIKPLLYFLLNEKGLYSKISVYIERVREFDFNKKMCGISTEKFERVKNEVLLDLAQNGYVKSLLHHLPQRNLFSCSSMQMMSATIGPDCNLYRCDNGLGKAELRIGDCEIGFYRNRYDSMYLNRNYMDKCKMCNLLPICGGGCASEYLIEKREIECDSVLQKLKTDVEIFMIHEKNKKEDTAY